MRELPVPTFALSPSHRVHAAMPRGSLHCRSQAEASKIEQLGEREDTAQIISVRSKRPVRAMWAQHLDEVREAQRLRHSIFAGEMGAQLPAHPQAELAAHDTDRFDDYCEHLIVRDGDDGPIVGTYRLLTPAQAKRVGGLYSDDEFDLSPLAHLRPRMVELGRSCVHADYRHGGVILALWSALFEFMQRNQLHSMVGCASIPMLHNGMVSGDVAASVWKQLQPTHMAVEPLRVNPLLPLPIEQLDSTLAVEPPPLIKGYLRLGARILGAPAWDPDFNTADLPMLLRTEDIATRYRRHFVSELTA